MATNDFGQLKRRSTAKFTILQIVGIIFILVVGDCFDWMNMSFDFTQLTTWKYWNGVIQQVLMYSMALVVGYLGRLEKEFQINKEYEAMMNLYHVYWNQIVQKTFAKFVDGVLNPRIKKEFYKDDIQEKLNRLEKKHGSELWAMEFSRALTWLSNNPSKTLKDYVVSDNIFGKYKWTTKVLKEKCKKYIVKRYALEILIMDEFIDKNCLSFYDYPRVNYHAFTWAIHSKSTNRKDKYKTESKVGKDISIGFIRKAFSVVLSAMVIGSIAGDPNRNELLDQAYGWVKLLIKYAIRVASIVWSWFSGLYFGKGVFESNYVLVVKNRNDILEEYITWKKENGIVDSDAQKIKETALYSYNTANIVKTLEDTPKEAGVSLSFEEQQKAINNAIIEKQKREIINGGRI